MSLALFVFGLVAIELVLNYLVWRIRGINRAMERRRRERMHKAREARRLTRARAQYEAAKRAVDMGVVNINEVRTAVIPRIPKPRKTRAEEQEELEYRAHF